MSFTSGTRFNNFGLIKDDQSIDILGANSDDVFDRAPMVGASVYANNGAQSFVSANEDPVLWIGADYDHTTPFWSSGAPSRITIPSGFAYAQFTYNVMWEDQTTDAYCFLQKNGGSSYSGMPKVYIDKFDSACFSSPVLAVTAGDFFIARMRQSSGTGKTFSAFLSVQAWKSTTVVANKVQQYVPMRSALKLRAPTAGQFNRVASNFEMLNDRVIPRYALLRMGSDKTVSRASTGIGTTPSFDTVVANPHGIFDVANSRFQMPADAKLARVVQNVHLSTFANRDVFFGGVTYPVYDLNAASGRAYQSIGYGTSGDGIQDFNWDSGFYSVSPGDLLDPTVAMGVATTTSATIKSDDATWFYLEVI